MSSKGTKQGRAGAAAAIALAWVLLAPASAVGASNTTTASLSLQVRPDVALVRQADSVHLRIRLARGSEARVWAAETCGLPLPNAQVISRSGSYLIPFVAISASSVSRNVCVSTTDGSLRASLPFDPVMAPARAAAPEVALAAGF